MKFLPIFYLITISILLYTCHPSQNSLENVEGAWKSIGYGEILKIETGQYYFYDITSVSCLPSQQGKVSIFEDRLSINDDTISIIYGTDPYYYTRMSSIPELCKYDLSVEKSSDPLYNFEVLASTIKEHFAYFERNKVNWDSLYTTSKNKISSSSSEAELYLVMEEVINALKDNHGYIEPTDQVYDQAEKLRSKSNIKQQSEELKEYGDFEIARIAAKSFLTEDMTRDTWLINWGKMNKNVGYIQVKTMWLYAELNLSDSLIQENGFVDTYVEAFNNLNEREYIEKEKEGIIDIMNKVMNDLSETDYMILDVRFNGGGQDAVSCEILRRFNDKRLRVARKKAVKKDGRTNETQIFLDSSSSPYTRPVYIMTSPQSASATDFLALASLELDNIKRIGSHTNGALSDALEKKLPNGWDFSISNEVYTDMKGRCYESIGIPVDYELNYSEDRHTFFRSVANDSEGDKKRILQAIDELIIKGYILFND